MEIVPERAVDYFARLGEPSRYLAPDLRYSSFQYLASSFKEGREYSIGKSFMNRIDLSIREQGAPISEEEFYSNGMDFSGTLEWTEGMTYESYEMILDNKINEIARLLVMENADVGATGKVLGFLSSMAGSVSHPIDIALLFVMPKSRALPAGRMAFGARSLHRFKEGIRTGLPVELFAEGMIFHTHQELQSEYGLADSFASVGMSTFAGGLMNASLGKIGDISRSVAARVSAARNLIEGSLIGETDYHTVRNILEMDPGSYDIRRSHQILDAIEGLDLSTLPREDVRSVVRVAYEMMEKIEADRASRRPYQEVSFREEPSPDMSRRRAEDIPSLPDPAARGVRRTFNRIYAEAHSRPPESRVERAGAWMAQRLFGTEVRFLQGEALFDGIAGAVFHSDPGRIYLRPGTLTDVYSVFSHELAHSLKYRDARAWNSILETIDSLYPDGASKYIDKVLKMEGEDFLRYSPEKQLDEAYATLFADAMKTPEFWSAYAKAAPDLARRIYRRIRYLLSKFRELFSENEDLGPLGSVLGQIVEAANKGSELDPFWRPGDGISPRAWVEHQHRVLYDSRVRGFSGQLKHERLIKRFLSAESDEDLVLRMQDLDKMASELAGEEIDLILRDGLGNFEPLVDADGNTRRLGLDTPAVKKALDEFREEMEAGRARMDKLFNEKVKWYQERFPARTLEDAREWAYDQVGNVAAEGVESLFAALRNRLRGWYRSVVSSTPKEIGDIVPHHNIPVIISKTGDVIPWEEADRVFAEGSHFEMWTHRGGSGRRVETPSEEGEGILARFQKMNSAQRRFYLESLEETNPTLASILREEGAGSADEVLYVNREGYLLRPNELRLRDTDPNRFESLVREREEILYQLISGPDRMDVDERVPPELFLFQEFNRWMVEDLHTRTPDLSKEDLLAYFDYFLLLRDDPEFSGKGGVSFEIHFEEVTRKIQLGRERMDRKLIQTLSEEHQKLANDALARMRRMGGADLERRLRAIESVLTEHRDEQGTIPSQTGLFDAENISVNDAYSEVLDNIRWDLNGLREVVTSDSLIDSRIGMEDGPLLDMARRFEDKFRTRTGLDDAEIAEDVAKLFRDYAGGDMFEGLRIVEGILKQTRPENLPRLLNDPDKLRDAVRLVAIRELNEASPDLSRRERMKDFSSHVREKISNIRDRMESRRSAPVRAFQEKMARIGRMVEAAVQEAPEKVLPVKLQELGISDVPHSILHTPKSVPPSEITDLSREILSTIYAPHRLAYRQGINFLKGQGSGELSEFARAHVNKALKKSDHDARLAQGILIEQLDKSYRAEVTSLIHNKEIRDSWSSTFRKHGLKGVLSRLDSNYRTGGPDIGLSAWNEYHATKQQLVDPVHTAILANGGVREWKKDGKMFRDVFRYLAGESPSSDKIRNVGDAIKSVNDYFYHHMQSRGAKIEYLERFTMRQRWNKDRIMQAGKRKFISDMSEMLDVPATLKNTDGAEDIGTYLSSVFDQIVSGQKTRQDYGELDGTRRFGHNRNLVFRDGFEVEADYLYGTGDPHQSLMRQLDENARAMTLIDHFGSKPAETRAHIEKLLTEGGATGGRARDVWDPNGLARLRTLFDGMTGELDHADNMTWAKIGGTLSKLADMSVLGGSGITALAMDPAHMVNQLQWMNVPLSRASVDIASSIYRSVRRVASREGGDAEAMLAGAGAGIDAVLNNAASRIGVEMAGGRGLLDKAHKIFFDINGLSPWLRVAQGAMVDVLQLRLAEWAKLPELGPVERRILARYGITPKEFKDFIVPAVKDYDLPHFTGERVTSDAVSQINPSTGRKLQALFEEGLRMGVIEPGLSEVSYLKFGGNPGTPSGVAQKMAAKYLSFPLAMQRRTYGRLLNGYGPEGVKELFGRGFSMGHIQAMQWMVMVLMGGAIGQGIKDILAGRDPVGEFSGDRLWSLIKYSGVAGFLPELYDVGLLPPISSAVKLAGADNFYQAANALTSAMPGQNLPVVNEGKHVVLGMMFDDWYGVHYQNRLDFLESRTGKSSIFQENE